MNARYLFPSTDLILTRGIQNLLRTLTDSKAKDGYPECDLKLLLTTVKDGRVSGHGSTGIWGFEARG
jgi:hypothetical protein